MTIHTLTRKMQEERGYKGKKGRERDRWLKVNKEGLMFFLTLSAEV